MMHSPPDSTAVASSYLLHTCDILNPAEVWSKCRPIVPPPQPSTKIFSVKHCWVWVGTLFHTTKVVPASTPVLFWVFPSKWASNTPQVSVNSINAGPSILAMVVQWNRSTMVTLETMLEVSCMLIEVGALVVHYRWMDYGMYPTGWQHKTPPHSLCPPIAEISGSSLKYSGTSL